MRAGALILFCSSYPRDLRVHVILLDSVLEGANIVFVWGVQTSAKTPGVWGRESQHVVSHGRIGVWVRLQGFSGVTTFHAEKNLERAGRSSE